MIRCYRRCGSSHQPWELSSEFNPFYIEFISTFAVLCTNLRSNFWDVVDEAGTKRSLAQWAANHLEEHGRPLRIAIDEAHWRYKNISDAKEAQIKEKCPGAHPRERAILERVLPLLRLGIQLLFVFDGEKRPERKRVSKRNSRREETTAVFKDMLEHIHVPWHQAPGEAEAECALLQQRGLVDAVWSEDGDSFMFGCTILLRNLRNDMNQKLKEEVKAFDMRDIRKTRLFNKKSITLFGMLTGCDYAPAGLKGCGKGLAHNLAENGGLVDGFWRIETEADAARWRTRLEEAIDRITSSSPVVFNKEKSNIRSFPDLEGLENCRKPVVSEAVIIDSLSFLHGEWYVTHTTESLKTTISWMQERFYSRKATIWWVERFVPVTINQRLLKNDSKARDLVAKCFLVLRRPSSSRREYIFSIDSARLIGS
ncbi:PIN domain-like protein [Colletotrichum cereale]|nr:PIN domain-like protein [Colletotrichum cereale]